MIIDRKKRIAIFISGTGSNMESLLKDLDDPNHPAKAVIVISDTDSALGIKTAQNRNILAKTVEFNQFNSKNEFEHELIKLIEQYEIEIICLAGFMRVLSKYFLQSFKNLIINIHPSILPSFKGLNTHERALKSGSLIHGATVHKVTEKVDSGKILGQGIVPVFYDDTKESLKRRVQEIEHKLYPLVLRRYLSNDPNSVLLFHKLTNTN